MARAVRRTVERDDAMIGDHGVDGLDIERTAGIPLQKGGRPCRRNSFARCRATASPFDSRATSGANRYSLVKVLDHVDVELASAAVPSALGRVDAPRHIWAAPGDVLAGFALRLVQPASILDNQPCKLPAGDAVPISPRRDQLRNIDLQRPPNLKNRQALQSEIDCLFVPEWNQNVNTFYALVAASSHDTPAFVAQANTMRRL